MNIIEGVIRPIGPFCRMQQEDNSLLSNEIKTIERDRLVQAQDNFDTIWDHSNPYFWQHRILVHLSLAKSIVSMTFIPSHKFVEPATEDPRKFSTHSYLNECCILFAQRQDLREEIIGFVNPYLSEDEQTTWGALPKFPKYDLIHNEASAMETIADLFRDIQDEIKESLKYFLQDKTTHALGITYSDSAGTYTTRGWIKA